MKRRNKGYSITFGANLKRILDLKKVTPEGVAALGGIETKQVYRAINAEHSPTIETVYAIAKGLEMHPKMLYDFEYKEEAWDNSVQSLAAEEGSTLNRKPGSKKKTKNSGNSPKKKK